MAYREVADLPGLTAVTRDSEYWARWPLGGFGGSLAIPPASCDPALRVKEAQCHRSPTFWARQTQPRSASIFRVQEVISSTWRHPRKPATALVYERNGGSRVNAAFKHPAQTPPRAAAVG